MLVTFFQRRPSGIHFSIEKLFDSLRDQLDDKIQHNTWISPCFSRGLWPRLRMMSSVSRFSGDVNHITGDIHFIALGLKKRNTILTIHDLGFLRNCNNPFNRWILKTFWISLPVNKVKIVTVVSEATKKELLQEVRVSPSKIRVIGNFISNAFHPVPKRFNAVQPRILHIGSAFNKNLDRLIEALYGIDCTLVMVGYPTETQKALLHRYRIDHEIHSGISEQELIEQYETCDLLAFVSLLEGFGLPIIEAQTVGRVVVTSNVSSMPEVAGKGACFVNPYDIVSIEDGIVKVINDADYRDQLITDGFENAKRFRMETVADQYYKLYEEIVKTEKSSIFNDLCAV